MAIEDLAGVILNAVGELVGWLLNPVLRLLGLSEIKAEQVANAIILLIGALFILGLIYITFKFS